MYLLFEDLQQGDQSLLTDLSHHQAGGFPHLPIENLFHEKDLPVVHNELVRLPPLTCGH
jgi:hypothetical protein